MCIRDRLEGRISGSIHYDNVAPCYLGGVQFMVQSLGNICQKLPFFDNWYWVLAYPGIEVSTAEARAILPKSCLLYTSTVVHASLVVLGLDFILTAIMFGAG